MLAKLFEWYSEPALNMNFIIKGRDVRLQIRTVILGFSQMRKRTKLSSTSRALTLGSKPSFQRQRYAL
jgi:hypothetical protein